MLALVPVEPVEGDVVGRTDDADKGAASSAVAQGNADASCWGGIVCLATFLRLLVLYTRDAEGGGLGRGADENEHMLDSSLVSLPTKYAAAPPPPPRP